MQISTFFAILLFPFFAFSQYNTPNLTDGGVIGMEYGNHSQSANLYTAAGQNWYLTWDNDSLYVAVTGTFNPANDAVNFFLDINPVIPVNNNNDLDGSINGITFDDTDAQLPFRADAFIFVKQGYDDYRLSDNLGEFGPRVGGVAKNIGFGTPNYVEFGIAWAKLTGAGRPAEFNFIGYISYNNGGFNGTFSAIPEGNPTHGSGGLTTQYFTHYFTVTNTNNAVATPPFSQISFTYREFGPNGYFLPKGDFFDITVHQNFSTDSLANENSLGAYDNNDTDNRLLLGGDSLDTLTIGRHLFIGVNSALLPADNTGGLTDPRGALIQFTGPGCRLYNFGRIDANPEVGSVEDIANRTLYIEVQDTLTLMPNNNIEIYRYRLGSITINPGAVLRADRAALPPGALGYDSFELQWGTLDVQGTLDMGDGTAGCFLVNTRGAVNPGPDNSYMITSKGGNPSINFYHLQVGRWTSFLRPDTSGTGPALILNLKGDLRNFSNFISKDGTGELNLRFNGIAEQEIWGTIGETGEPTKAFSPIQGASPTIPLPVQVMFNDIEIDNASGLDVNFQSFEPTIPTITNIDYLIAGELKLTNGDLITRDRLAPAAVRAVHTVTIADAAPAPVFSGARSDMGAGISSFVDGPLSYEVSSSGALVREFPIGKTNGAIGDYRHLKLDLNYASNPSTVYTAEMFIEDGSGNFTFPANPCPDLLGRISTVRYWDVNPGFIAGLTSAVVTVDYDVVEADDEVVNAAEVRLLKEVGTAWENVSCGQGGTANGKGTISSLAINDFGEFILAFPPNVILDAGVLALSGKIVAGKHTLTWQEDAERRGRYQLLKNGEKVFEANAGDIIYRWQSQENRLESSVYQLVWVNENGEATYSNTIELGVEKNNELIATISENRLITTLPGPGQVELFDLQGRRVFGIYTDETQFITALPKLTSGIYTLVFTGEGKRLVKKVSSW